MQLLLMTSERMSFHFTLPDTSFVYISGSWAVILYILISNCCFWFSNIWTLRLPPHMKRHLICFFITAELNTSIQIFGHHISRHLRNCAIVFIYFYIFELFVMSFIWKNTLFALISYIHWIGKFGGHLGRHHGRHLGDYAIVVIDFHIVELYVLHIIWINTSFYFEVKKQLIYIFHFPIIYVILMWNFIGIFFMP